MSANTDLFGPEVEDSSTPAGAFDQDDLHDAV